MHSRRGRENKDHAAIVLLLTCTRDSVARSTTKSSLSICSQSQPGPPGSPEPVFKKKHKNIKTIASYFSTFVILLLDPIRFLCPTDAAAERCAVKMPLHGTRKKVEKITKNPYAARVKFCYFYPPDTSRKVNFWWVPPPTTLDYRIRF